MSCVHVLTRHALFSWEAGFWSRVRKLYTGQFVSTSAPLVDVPILPQCGGPDRCGIALINIPEPPPVPLRVFNNPFVEMPPLPSTPSGLNTESTVWDDDLIEE
jgi:hypothetical protein